GDELLDIVFSNLLIGADPSRNFTESFHDDAVRFVGSLDVRLLLRGGPDSFELLDQFGAGNGFDAKRADEFDRAGIDPRHVRDVVHWGILHRDVWGSFLLRCRAMGIN